MADRIEANYELLADVQNRLNGLHETVGDIRTKLTSAVEPLLMGDWKGEGSEAFFSENSEVVYPSLDRLSKAIENAAAITQAIGKKFQESEDAGRSQMSGRGS
jgi:WXG100 family type VII secretion target